MEETSIATEQSDAQVSVNKQADVPAGFWIRFLAFLIDSGILFFVTLPLKKLVNISVGIKQTFILSVTDLNAETLALSFVLGSVINIVLTVAYFGWFYANKGATPGKMVLGLKVVDMESRGNLSYLQTFLREVIGKSLSAFLLLGGYLIAGFRSDKRALHDLLFGTQVVEKD